MLTNKIKGQDPTALRYKIVNKAPKTKPPITIEFPYDFVKQVFEDKIDTGSEVPYSVLGLKMTL